MDKSTDIFIIFKKSLIIYSSHLTCSSVVTVSVHRVHEQKFLNISNHAAESYCSGGGAIPGPQKTQLHAGPSMQFPLRAPRAMQLWLQSFGIQLSPNLITVGVQSASILLLLSVDAIIPTSSANFNMNFFYQNNCINNTCGIGSKHYNDMIGANACNTLLLNI